MKKIILILIIGINSVYSQSQKKWFTAIGIETYQNMSYNRVDNTNEFAVAYHNTNNPKYGYSFGVNAKILDASRLTFTGAFGYTNAGFNQPTFINYGDLIDPQRGFQYNTPKPGESAGSNFEWRFNYIDLGIGTNFNILNKKTKLYVSLAPELNYLISFKHISTQYDINETLLKKDKDDRTVSYEIRRFNASLNIGIGCEFNIGKRINIFTQLNYKQILFTVTPKFYTKDILYSYGLKTGIRYNL